MLVITLFYRAPRVFHRYFPYLYIFIYLYIFFFFVSLAPLYARFFALICAPTTHPLPLARTPHDYTHFFYALDNLNAL